MFYFSNCILKSALEHCIFGLSNRHTLKLIRFPLHIAIYKNNFSYRLQKEKLFNNINIMKLLNNKITNYVKKNYDPNVVFVPLLFT